jgi:hypothetical protein
MNKTNVNNIATPKPVFNLDSLIFSKGKVGASIT